MNNIEIDPNKTKSFWKKRGKLYGKETLGTITMFSDNQHYIDYMHNVSIWHIKRSINLDKYKKILDIGCGCGREDFELAPSCKSITGIDYTQTFIDAAKKEAKRRQIDNIDFYCKDATKLGEFGKFDIILITGTLIYMTNEQVQELMKVIKLNLKKGGVVLSRESTAVKEEIIRDEYDLKFAYDYNAHYRTNKQLSSFFKENGFKLKYENYLFHPMNNALVTYNEYRNNIAMQLKIKEEFYKQLMKDKKNVKNFINFKYYVEDKYEKIQKVYVYEKQ